MFVNIKKVLEDGLDCSCSVTEFYPTVDDKVLVPASKIGGRPFFAFGDCNPDAMTVGSLPEKHILTKEEYEKAFKKFLKDVNEDSELDCYFDDIEILYQRYQMGVNMFALAGVVSLVNVDEGADVTYTSGEGIHWVPNIDMNNKLDIESYWKATMYIVPNIVADASTIIGLYKTYKKNDMISDKKPRPCALLLKSEGIKDFVDSIKDGLKKTDMEESEIKKLLGDDDLENESDMIPYFKYMLSKHDASVSSAISFLYLIFKSHYKKVYESLDIDEYYETGTMIVIKNRLTKKSAKLETALF